MQKRTLISAALAGMMIGLAACDAVKFPSTMSRLGGAGPVVIQAPTAAAEQANTRSLPAVGGLSDYETTLQRIYAVVNPGVVNIRVVQKETVQNPTLPAFPGVPFFGQRAPSQPQERVLQGAGSGFVWDSAGHIVTNNHVVAGSDKIEVTFSDGTVRRGELVGADLDSDLAVLKVELPALRLHPLQLADSAQVRVGELAVAIGNPFGLEGTMTAGIVSALGRALPVDAQDSTGQSYTIPDIIQTDAPINPGNSGGVLVNDQAQLIGVTSAIASPVRASSGVGFAIPSDIVAKVVPALIKTGRYEHTWLGISGTTVTLDIAQKMKLDVDQHGALIVDVMQGSPAAEAGLKGSAREFTLDGQQMRVGGDVITAIDGQPIASFDDLVAYLVRNTEVGQKIELTFLRGGRQQTVTLKVTARPSSPATLQG